MLRLDNMVKAITLLDAQEYAEASIATPFAVTLDRMHACITRCMCDATCFAYVAEWLEALTKRLCSDLAVGLQLVEDVQEEAKRYGAMQSVFVPRPPPTVTPDEPARVFIRSVSGSRTAQG